MARISSFEMAKEKIKRYFDKADTRIFSRSELIEIFEKNHEKWKLAKSMNSVSFLDALVQHADFAPVDLSFRNISVHNYFYKHASMIALASNITRRSYLSHYTSLFVHDLTEQIPKVIYVTNEQSKKVARVVDITQESIDKAFNKEQRISENSAPLADYKAVLLEGKYSNNLGVITDTIHDTGERIKLTDIERTLIDVTVRPNYAGGVYEVLKAYERAAGKVSVNKMMAMLSKLDYIYPYHQSIGFYLEKSGVYKPSILQIVSRYEMRYNFYLTYNMKEAEYSEKWKIFYPKDL